MIKIPTNSKALIIALFLALFFAGGCSKREFSPKGSLQNQATEVKQEVYTFKIEGFNKERKIQWVLEGESARVINDKIKIKNLSAIYYGDKEIFNLTCEKAIYDKETQNIELSDNVVGKSSTGGEFATNYAQWLSRLEEIRTDSYVIVKRDNVICKGRGLITKPRLKWVIFNKDVEVDFDDGKKITCSGPFEIDHEKNIAIFKKNVKILDKNSQMFADMLTVYLHPDTNKIERIVTSGSVKMIHKGSLENVGNFAKTPFILRKR